MPQLLTPWQSEAFYVLRHCPSGLSDWLLTKESMTRRLRKESNERLTVQILKQHWGLPSIQEALFLGIPHRHSVLIREVFLCGGGRPWMFARSIFPHSLFTGEERWLQKKLDENPIGPILYRHKAMKKSPPQFAKLNPTHEEYEILKKYMTMEEEILWARRACFYLNNKPLLVSEILLPEIGQ